MFEGTQELQKGSPYFKRAKETTRNFPWVPHVETGLDPIQTAPLIKLLQYLPGQIKRRDFEHTLACFSQVHRYLSKLNLMFPNFSFQAITLKFDSPVSAGKIAQEGQYMLRISRVGVPTPLMVMDVAANLYGFPYREMPIAIGTLNGVCKITSDLYSQQMKTPISVEYIPPRV